MKPTHKDTIMIQLTPSYFLTDSEGHLSVLERSTGNHFGPNDIVSWYPSWGLQPCRLSVQRAAAILSLSPEESDAVSKFCIQS